MLLEYQRTKPRSRTMAPLISRTWSRVTGSSVKEEEEEESLFVKNGSELAKGLVASCEGKYYPFRNFIAEEIISMSDNFGDLKESLGCVGFIIYKGCLENGEVLVRIYSGTHYLKSSHMINNIVFTLRVGHHKNILKLLGCCLEFAEPALVYEYPSGGKLLYDLIYNHKKVEPLQWKSRLKIARDIAGVLVYLHTAFSTPIIYRDLTTNTILVDEFGVAKLFDFSLCIPLPPGKIEMEDVVCRTYGFAEPEFKKSGTVTTKIDVYSFGVFLLVLLTGRPMRVLQKIHRTEVVADVMNECVGEDMLKKIVDPILLSNASIGNTEEYGQFQAFLELAERCILDKREERPEMLDVAKELKLIERFSHMT